MFERRYLWRRISGLIAIISLGVFGYFNYQLHHLTDEDELKIVEMASRPFRDELVSLSRSYEQEALSLVEVAHSSKKLSPAKLPNLLFDLRKEKKYVISVGILENNTLILSRVDTQTGNILTERRKDQFLTEVIPTAQENLKSEVVTLSPTNSKSKYGSFRILVVPNKSAKGTPPGYFLFFITPEIFQNPINQKYKDKNNFSLIILNSGRSVVKPKEIEGFSVGNAEATASIVTQVDRRDVAIHYQFKNEQNTLLLYAEIDQSGWYYYSKKEIAQERAALKNTKYMQLWRSISLILFLFTAMAYLLLRQENARLFYFGLGFTLILILFGVIYSWRH